ncbi:MAG: guanylate kinase [Nitrospinae bacterium]|nr:guanylate kinase [Nitrospinota bacterium]
MKKSKGVYFVLSAPSGCGKTTIGNILLKEVSEIVRSISHTTREKREGEVDGHDYFFVSMEEFQILVTEKEFIEWEKVHSSLYGTSKTSISDLSKTSDVLLIIDYRGAVSLKKEFPEDTVTIFLIPPSIDRLVNRIKGSKDSRVEELEIRLETARMELQHADDFDYIIENDILEKAVEEIKAIIYAERLKRNRKEKKIQDMLKERL